MITLGQVILNLMTSEKKKKKKNHQRHFLSIVIIDSLINHYKGNRNSA